MRRFLGDTRANVMITFGIMAPVLVLATSVAYEFSDGARHKASLQATADSAALAGVRALGANRSLPQTVAEPAATLAASQFISARSPDAKPVIQASAEAKTVYVGLAYEKPTTFGGVLGQSIMNIDANATATYEAAFKPCMLALGPDEPSGIELIGSAKINAPKCGVGSNATSAKSIVTQGAAKIVAEKICTAGNAGGAKATPPPEKCNKTEDPYGGNILKSKTNGTTSGSVKTPVGGTSSYTGPCLERNLSIGASAKGSQKLNPGVYCGGLSIQSADVELAPGLYVIQDGPLSLQGNATLTGKNVSILLSGVGAVLDLQGSPTLELTAMTTGVLAGVAIASDTPASPVLTSKLQGSPDLKVTGSIYLPNQRFDMQGSPVLDMLGGSDTLMALSFQLQGSPDIKIRSDFAGNLASAIRLIK